MYFKILCFFCFYKYSSLVFMRLHRAQAVHRVTPHHYRSGGLHEVCMQRTRTHYASTQQLALTINIKDFKLWICLKKRNY